MTNSNHNHGTDLWGASQCSPECHIKASTAKAEQQAKMLEESKGDINIGGGYTHRKRG